MKQEDYEKAEKLQKHINQLKEALLLLKEGDHPTFCVMNRNDGNVYPVTANIPSIFTQNIKEYLEEMLKVLQKDFEEL